MATRLLEVHPHITAIGTVIGALLCATCNSDETARSDAVSPSQHAVPGLALFHELLAYAREHPASQEADGYRIRQEQGPSTAVPGHWGALSQPAEAWVPAQANAAMRLLTGAGYLSVRRLGEASMDAKLDKGVLVFANPSVGYQAIMLAGYRGVQDILLRKESGGRLGYEIELPPGWRLHRVPSDERLVEVRDAYGIARLRLVVRSAFDSTGKAIPVRAEVRGSTITIQAQAIDAATVHAEWQGTGAPAFDRDWPVTTLLRTGKVLVTGELPRVELGDGHPGELYDPLTSTFTTTAEFVSFLGKAVVQLPSGWVVAFGKVVEKEPRANDITIYDPDADRAIKVIRPPAQFFPDNALALPNGKIFVCGRDASNTASDIYTAWIFTPTSASAGESVSPIELSKQHHLAGTPLLLSSGKVAVVGRGGGYAVYDPDSGAISGDAIESPADAVMLGDGQILIFKGDGTATVLTPESGARREIPMPQSRANVVGIRLASGKVLVVDTGNGLLSPASYVFDPISNGFTDATQINGDGAYYRPALTYLPGGGVLMLSRAPAVVVGTASKARPQVYLPTWDTHAIRSLRVPRLKHSVTLLRSGDLLIAGGDSAGTAEIYDAKKRQSRIIGKLIHPRSWHTANILESGKVLLVGGNEESAEAELFNPDDKTFVAVPRSSNVPIYQGHQATPLASGKILITGGTSRTSGDPSSQSSMAEVYDPKENRFSQVGDMIHGRAAHAAILLDNGNVLVVGGLQNRVLAEGHAELYDESQNSFVPVGPVRDERYGASAVRLRSGKVLIAQATPDKTLELFDPGANTFSLAGKPKNAYASVRVLGLSSGKVIITGTGSAQCRGAFVCEESEVYDETANQFIPAPRSFYRLSEYTTTALPGDRLLMSGGEQEAAGLFVHDFGSAQTVLAESSPASCSAPTLTALPDGKIFRLGFSSFDPNCAGSIVDVLSNTPEKAVGVRARNRHRAILLSSGKVFAIGAFTSTEPEDLAIEFDPSTFKIDSFSSRYGWDLRVPTMLSDGRVLLTGGIDDSGKPILEAEVFNANKSGNPFEDIGKTQGRTPPTSVLLGTGDVLLTGLGAQTVEVFDRASMKFLDTSIRGIQKGTHAATRLASGDALLMGGTASFLFHATTRSVEYGIGLPRDLWAGISLLSGDVIAATPSEMVRLSPGRNIIRDPYPIPNSGTFAPLRNGGFLHGASSQWLVSSPVPDAVHRPQISNIEAPIVSGFAVTIRGTGFSRCTSVGCKLGPGSAFGPPTVAFLPLDGGAPHVSSVLNWTDDAIRWVVPASAYHGMGWVHVIVDGVPSEGVSIRLDAAPNGARCTNDAECESGVCTGAICCNRRCNTCESCRREEQIDGAETGKCWFVKPGTDPYDVCDEKTPDSCGSTGVCDGKGRCELHPIGTPCPNNGQCNAGACLHCSEDQRWVLGGTEPQDCLPYRCTGGVCPAQCVSDDNCLKGYRCNLDTHTCGAYCGGEDFEMLYEGEKTVRCHPYRCFSGACAKKCISNLECTNGYMCNLDKDCELYVPMSLPDQSCAAGGPPRKDSSWEGIAALSACLWFLQRGRRRVLLPKQKQYKASKSV